MKKHIPNLITCLNLCSGMAGIYVVLEGRLLWGAYFVMAAAVFDFLDGFVAKLLKAHSEIGKQLDSLADMVTFGVLPAFIAFKLLQSGGQLEYLPYLSFLIGIQSALRLAKFNIDERQSERFIGLPTPANALFFSTLPHLAMAIPELGRLLLHPILIGLLVVLFAFLLTAELPLLALKFKTFSVKKNFSKYLLLAIGLVVLVILGTAGVPFIVVTYLLLSLVENLLTKHAVQT
ncbi:CDP-diacylglycerol--serine O-phosphatidyltransferase [Lunatimonas salinarum]|uniref:CDP-diacylglycerol--serine O-phosphatidyltransferase n=1 Tax=Lunatimonas salinarum TaxID=1774590 RepID=UPI0031596775